MSSFLAELEELNIYKSPQEEIDYLRGEYKRLCEIEEKYLQITKGFGEDYLKQQLEKADRYDQLVEKAAKIAASSAKSTTTNSSIQENTGRRREWQKQKDEKLRELEKLNYEYGTHYDAIQRVRGMVNPY